MRSFGVLASLVAFFAASASSQQYAGEVIDTSLPNVPGSEIAFFKIPGVMDSNKKKPANLTLINYMSRGSDGKRLVESKVQRAVIIIHGLNRDPGTYESNMLSALAQVTGDPNISKDSVAVMSPYFANGDDKRIGYPWTDGLSAGRGSTTSALVWKGSQWSAGGNNQYPYYSQTTSSYTVLDTLVQYFDDRTLFPNMKQIVVAGHSLGAQTVHRYAALGQKLNTNSPVTYWVGNPNSYIWLSTDRPLSTASCPTYDYYRDGYTNFTEYPMTYGQSLVSQGRSAILANYNSKQIAYARGTQDNGDDSSTCAPGTTGGNRNERFFNFIKAFPISCPDPRGSNCDTVDFVNMGHDGGGMFASAAGRARLFTDNFYGNGNRSYDFGYPRQQDGDDPFPDPTLNMTASSLNNITYAGNLTYAGCWSDSGSSRTLPTQVYDNSANTIELCTSTCVSRGFSIAGLEFGSQCYCGNAMTSGASKVIESSCTAPCAGNSSESCGGSSRLSVFSNGTPYVLPPASNPETVGKFYFSNCYAETGARALPVNGPRGSFMTLEYCANACSSYKYFGTEYGSECYCGNAIDPSATIASVGECSMTCANNTIQYCGAGNRLTLFTNPDWVQPTGSSTSSSPSAPTASGGASDLACPAANNTVVTSNGLKFIVECGIDHAGGDLTSVGGVTFQQCIAACSSNSQCVDVSLSGSACYLKKAVGAAVNIPAVWGARLLTDGSSTTLASSNSNTGTSSSPSGAASSLSSSTTSLPSSSETTTTSTSPSSAPSDISCPASDATTYTSPSGQSFVIECGIDHMGGDMGMKSVSSFQQCIDACDQTKGCLDVSLSGSACYLKSTLGAPGKAPSVWGAKLISPSASSTLSGASSSSSAASTSTDVSSSSISSGTSVSATPTAVSCPGSNGSLYPVASGNSFLIECGIDHQGGDLSSKDVKSFADCISLCDTTANCVDISMVGNACYLKNAVGPAVKLDYVWGAKLVEAASSSPSSSLATTVATTSSSDVASSSQASSTASDSSISSSSSLTSSSSPQSSLATDTDVTSSSSQTPSSSVASSVSSSSALDTTTDSSLTTSSSSSTETTSSSSSRSGSDSAVSSTPSSSISASQATPSSSTTSTTQTSPTITDSTSTVASSSTASSSAPPSSSSTYSSSVVPTSAGASSNTASSSSVSSPSSTTPSSSGSSSSSAASLSSTAATPTSSTSGFTTVASSTTTSSAASSATAVLPAGFSYAGCFVDGSTRALPISAGTSTTQTQQQCAMTCQTKGYKYSGTEYAQECWCGNTIPSSPASESQCSMACKGDSTQKCGAGNRLSVVSDDSWKQTFFARQSFGAWNLLGCYTDSTSKRSLPTSISLAAYGGGANATIANCVQACQAKGFAYCGAEYYSECYGSNVAPLTSLAGSDPLAAGCNYPCKGNSTESCGGSARLIVYSNAGS